MIYYREKINSFTDALHNCSVIVLVSQNYNLLQKEAQKISYKDAPIVSDKLFDTLFHTSNVDSERKKSGGGNFTRKKRNKKPIVGKNTKKNKSKHK